MALASIQAQPGHKKRSISLLVTLLINLLIVGYIALREFRNNAQEVQRVSIADIRLIFLLFGVVCFFFAAWMDYSKYRNMIRVAEGTDDPKGAREVALLGKYYDNITPFGAGGQPFQIHYLKKRGYSAGTSGAAPVIGFLTQQIAFVLIGIVVFVTNRSVLDSIPLLHISAYVGLVMYALLPMGLLLFAAFPRPFKAVVRWAIRLLAKLHIIRDAEKATHTTIASLDDYLKCIRLFRKRPIFFAKLIFLSCLYQLAILSIPFFMLRAFGGVSDWWTSFSLVVYIYAAITIIPTPGNSGAAEGSFYAVFSSLEGGMLFWAMIAWRFLVYYSWLICGIIVLTRSTMSHRKAEQKVPPQEGKLRIVLACDTFLPTVNGITRTVDAYARQMQAEGHEICVICPRRKHAGYDLLPYPVLTVPALRLRKGALSIGLGLSSRAVRRLFRHETPDVVHIHSPFFVGRMALRLARRNYVPSVATFHSKYYDDAWEATHSKLLAKITVNFAVDTFAKADTVWACSKSAGQTLRGYGYNGVIRVMENGVDPQEAPEELVMLRAETARRFSMPEGKRTLLFVGQLGWQKNLRLVLDTMQLLCTQDRRYQLVLVGDGYRADAIRAYADKLGIADQVFFVGAQTERSSLYGLYAFSDLLFFPSVYDNAPLVLREAALAKLPALLAEGSNAAEVVQDGVNGFTAAASPGAMAVRIQRIFDNEDVRAVGREAKRTIPIPWESIVSRALCSYRSGGAEGHSFVIDRPRIETDDAASAKDASAASPAEETAAAPVPETPPAPETPEEPADREGSAAGEG